MMAFNVMDMITGALTPDNIGAVANAMGMDNDLVAKGLGAAMPAILAAVLGSASSPEGQAKLDSALNEADPGILDNLGGLLGDGGSAAMIASGSKMLSSFMGDSSLGQLAGALGSSLGAPKESSGSLLGLAAPMVMGMLAGKKQSEGMDIGGLVSSLMGQKELIGSAIPDDITKELSGSGIFDDLLGSAGGSAIEAVAEAVSDAASGAASGAAAAASAAAETVEKAADTTAQAAADTAEAAGSSSLLKWIVIAAIVLGAVYFLMGKRSEEAAQADPAAAITAFEQTLLS
jgi:hypothetical protein